jgi:hypothetical protein
VIAADGTRYLFIVSRRDRSLYQYAVRVFSRTPEIQVIYDRRQSERRRTSQTPPVDRRRGDRRVRAQVDADIRDYGSAMVRTGERRPAVISD